MPRSSLAQRWALDAERKANQHEAAWKESHPREVMELIPYVDEVCAMLVNGHFHDGLEAVINLPKRQAVVVAAYVIERLSSENSKSVFLRMLESYGEGPA